MQRLRNIMTKIPLIIKAVSFHVIILTALFVTIQLNSKPIVAATVEPVRSLVTAKPTPIEKQIITGKPISIAVARLAINLPIHNGTYDDKTGQWSLSDDAAYFATITKQPNDQSGNTFIYGHNTQRIFAPLSQLVKGDTVTIKTANGHTFTYSYTGDTFVPPDLTSVLYDNPASPRLTIMTCEGVWSQARRLMYFNFVGVS